MERFTLIDKDDDTKLAHFSATDEDDAWAQFLNDGENKELIEEMIEHALLEYRSKYNKEPNLKCFQFNPYGKVNDLDQCLFLLNMRYEMKADEDDDEDENEDEFFEEGDD